MAKLTKLLKLFKWDLENTDDLNEQFNIEKSLNENFDKIDEAIEQLQKKIENGQGTGGTTDFTESDPNVPQHVKGITEEDIKKWNDKSEFSGDYNDLKNKPEIPDTSNFITNAVDDLVNYYDKAESYSKEEINNIVNNISTLNILVVENLPTKNISTSTIYLIAKENSEDNNVYDEYIYVSENWEKIGDTKISLEGLATEEYVNTKIGDIDTLLSKIADESEAI